MIAAAAQQSDNPLAVAGSLALIMGAIYVLGTVQAIRRRRAVRRHPAGGQR